MGQNRVTYILLIICVILFIVIIATMSFGVFRVSWTYDYTIKPIEFVNLIMVFVSAIFATWFITKKLTEERYEKELIINDLKAIEEQMKKILLLYDSPNSNSRILASINQLSILINRIQNCNKTCRESNISNSFRAFYSAATDFTSSSNSSDIDIYLTQQAGENLIIQVRRIISKINTK